MADNAASSQEDDLSLPRAAVNKMIKEMIPMIRVSNDARELVLNCCTEFIHLIASEANEICNKQAKKTISPEHVILALESLGFQDYIKDVEGVYKQFKTQAQTRKKNNKLKNQGVSEDELLRQQQALFAQARAEQAQEEWMHMQQQQQQGLIQQQAGVVTGMPQVPVTAGLLMNQNSVLQQPILPQHQVALVPLQIHDTPLQNNTFSAKPTLAQPSEQKPMNLNNTATWDANSAISTSTHTNNLLRNTELGNT